VSEIFLSYSRADRARAQAIVGQLSSAGMTVWWDALLEEGTSFRSEIDSRLVEAKLVLVLWTETSVRSTWVIAEALQARDTARLISLCVAGVVPPVGFRQHQFLQLPQEMLKVTFDRLKGLCKNALAQPQLPFKERRGFVTIDFAHRYRLRLLPTVLGTLVIFLAYLATLIILIGIANWRGIDLQLRLTSDLIFFYVFAYASLLIGRMVIPDAAGVFRSESERLLERRPVMLWLTCYGLVSLGAALSLAGTWSEIEFRPGSFGGAVIRSSYLLLQMAAIACGFYSFACVILRLLHAMGFLSAGEKVMLVNKSSVSAVGDFSRP
jgi:hypothetical protein